jgi:hypothetical protein
MRRYGQISGQTHRPVGTFTTTGIHPPARNVKTRVETVKRSAVLLTGHVKARASNTYLNLLLLVALPVVSVIHQKVDAFRLFLADR